MEHGQREKMLSYLDQLMIATKSTDINWVQANPSTFVWDNKEKRGRLVLQQVTQTPKLSKDGKLLFINTYVLQVLDSSGNQKLVLKGSSDDDINARLSSLFEQISNLKTQTAIDFLAAMLPETKA